jgi:NTP pyrophosphatase (non-canonical NTP hydrolase)
MSKKMKECKLEQMFALRLSFMNMMKETIPDSYPEFPVDISEKSSQQVCRDLALKGVEEMFEALQHLKNWKPHRVTNVDEELNREEFLEEVVDALNYFFAMLIVTGFNEKELFEAYLKKDSKIRERLLSGY